MVILLKWVGVALAVVLAVAVVAYVVGSRLPREHAVTVSARYAAPPDLLWRVISDVRNSASFRRDIESVELLASSFGVQRWRERSRHGTTTYVMDAWDPPHRMVTRIADDALPYGGSWEFRVERDGTGSRLSITERGFVTPPVFRFMQTFVFGLTRTLEQYHRSLGEHFGERVTPVIDG